MKLNCSTFNVASLVPMADICMHAGFTLSVSMLRAEILGIRPGAEG